MDMNAVMTTQGMRDTTSEQRDTWVNDAVQIRQMAQIIHARIAHTLIDGDKGQMSARRRAGKVSRKWRRAARLVEKAAAEMEAANAVYVREVVELPARRAAELERKETRRQRLGIAASTAEAAVTKSLGKSTDALHGGTPVGNPQVTAAQQAPQYVSPMPYQWSGSQGGAQTLPDFNELFPEAL
ncbi:hypothetical protein [Streptomyces sp. AS02]|uniref:hypothetical protein n=1 Tax=Streptomyces sp. AS02 TaxID=2938946 RepID=UPI0020203FD5|nr:hypothetical protein [Streptomyces sp. AS02]MCL8016863.1 hypothetical protein [Streptomyces sp. AS02]